ARVTRQVVARAGDVAPGTSRVVNVAGREIGIFNVSGEYFALANRCPHAGGPLCPGPIVPLVQSQRPPPHPPDPAHGVLAWPLPRNACAAPGTAGSSTSAPGNPGAIRGQPARGSSPSRSSPGRNW